MQEIEKKEISMEAIHINDFNNKKINESDVIKRIINGEKELFEILVRRYNQKLYRVIRSYIKNEPQIEDIMQNSYIKAYTKLYQFKLESSFSTWLIRIAINESLANLNEKKKNSFINEDSTSEDAMDIHTLEDSSQVNPQDHLIQQEAKHLIEKAIDHLDLKYREVYILKELEEMSLKEISEALDISVPNVKVRFHRAKQMLKEKLFELSNSKNIFEFGFSRCDRITEYVMTQI